MGKRFKFTPQKPGIIPKAKPGRHGRPRSPKVEVQYPLNLRGIAERGYRKARRRAHYRARLARLPGLSDRFFRLFSMFLVCLVLFTVVSGAGYESYQSAVHVLYETTEVVGAAGAIVARGLVEVTGVVDGLYEKPALTGSGILKLKIKGDWLSFAVEETSWAYGFTYHAYKVIETPIGYEDWKGEMITKIFSWYLCPDFATRKGEFTDYSEGE